MAFRSDYPGRCKACGMQFPAGTRLTGTRGNYRHVSCGERRVSPGMGFTVTPQPVAPVAPVAASTPDRLASAVNAETQRVPTAPRVVPSWVASFSAAPDAVAERERAIAERRERARAIAERNRAPINAPRAVEEEEEGSARISKLDLRDSGTVRLANVLADVFDGPASGTSFTPTPEPEEEGAARFRKLELD